MTNTNFSQAQSAPTTASADTHQTIDELVFELSNSTPVVGVDVLAKHTQDATDDGSTVTPKKQTRRIGMGLVPQYTPGQEFSHGEVGCAERLAAFYGHTLRFDTSQQNWMLWTGSRWQVDTVGTVVECMKEVARHMTDVEAPAMHALSQEQGDYFSVQAKELRDMGKRLHNSHTLDGAIKMARSVEALVVEGSKFDADPLLLNCLSGTIDLRSGSVRPHSMDDLITKITPIPLATASEDCPRWKQFLLEIMQGDAELVAYLHRMVGYILTGSTTEQVFFMLHGQGANGKSVFLNVLRRLMGDFCKVADFTTFLDTNRGAAARPDLAGFVGKRLILASESAQGKQLDEAVMKQFTGGDVISVRELYKGYFEFTPVGKVLLATNHKPKVQGTDYGIWRRMRLIRFLASFKDDQCDPNLEAKLEAELPAILRWAVEGCIEWRQQGLGMPAAIKDAVKEYQSSMDTFQHFLDETCAIEPNAQVASQSLFDAYKSWAQAAGIRFPLAQQGFNNNLKDRGFTPKRTRTSNVWVGLRLETGSSTAMTQSIGSELCFE